MAPRRVMPEDERVWSNPGALHQLPGGGLNSESVHWYFYNSHFFDPASNNTAVLNDASRHPEGAHILNSRNAFEDAVRSMPSGGIQFLVVGEPESPDGPWIIQKQNRIVQRSGPDKIEVLGTYWVLGEQIMMAPNLADILDSRFLCLSTSLNNFFSTAADLSLFTPATKHTYFPDSYKSSKSAVPGNASRATTPDLGMEGDSQAPAPSQTSNEMPAPTFAAESIFTSERLLEQSYSLLRTYGNEYSDEIPLQGEPGSFVFNSTYKAVASKQAAEAAQKEATKSFQTNASQLTTSQKSADAAPTPKSPIDAAGPSSRKGSVVKPKMKDGRRKSKATMTPTSPTGPGIP